MKQRILIIEDDFTIHTVVFTKNGKCILNQVHFLQSAMIPNH